MSLDQSAYPDHQWDPALAHAAEECPTPVHCDNGHAPASSDRAATGDEGRPDPALRSQGKCALLYDRHPTQPHLTAICNRPLGHDGDHSNVLPKGGDPS